MPKHIRNGKVVGGAIGFAKNLFFDKTKKNLLTTTNVQDAIDELSENLDEKIGSTDISSIGDGTITGAVKEIKNQLTGNLVVDNTDTISCTITSGATTSKADVIRTKIWHIAGNIYYVSFRLSATFDGDTWATFNIPYFASKTFNGRHVLTGMGKDLGLMVRAENSSFTVNSPNIYSDTALDFNGIVVIN